MFSTFGSFQISSLIQEHPESESLFDLVNERRLMRGIFLDGFKLVYFNLINYLRHRVDSLYVIITWIFSIILMKIRSSLLVP